MGKLFDEKCESILSEEIDAKEVKTYVTGLGDALDTIENIYTDFGHAHNPEWIAEVLADMDETEQHYVSFKSDLENAKKEWPRVRDAFEKLWKAQDALEAAHEAMEKLAAAGINMQKKNAYLGVGR